MAEIVNKIEQSGLVEINLEDFYPKGKRSAVDIKDWLFQGLILREKEFRDHVKSHDWSQYKDQYVSIGCSADAIIPTWAYMLIASALQPHAKKYVFGDQNLLETALFLESLQNLNTETYRDKKVMVRGCGQLPVPDSAYVELTRILTPVVKSLMFGEACSTVPVYKNRD